MTFRLSRRVLSAEVRRDLLQIQEYMLEHAPEHWRPLRDRIDEAIRKIASRPALGRQRTDLLPESYRFFLVHPYYLIFQKTPRGIVITRIMHSSRDIPAALENP